MAFKKYKEDKEDKEVVKTVKKLVWAELPLISVLPKSEMQEAREALEELESINQLQEMYTEREDELKTKLREIQNKHELMGVRFGQLAFAATSTAGRKTLSTTKLIEAGVSAKVIEGCYIQGDPCVRKEFKNLDRSRKKKGASGGEEEE